MNESAKGCIEAWAVLIEESTLMILKDNECRAVVPPLYHNVKAPRGEENYKSSIESKVSCYHVT